MFSLNEIRQLDDIIYPHYERGLITDWHYGKGKENSFLSAIDDKRGDQNQIFCVTKEARKNEFTNYKVDIPRIKLLFETVNFDKVARALKVSLEEVPADFQVYLRQQQRLDFFKS